MTKLWIGGALTLLLVTAGAQPVAAHTAGGCGHSHTGGTSTCDQHGAKCTLASGEEGVCRQRSRNCLCEAKRADEPSAPETGPAVGFQATDTAAEPIRLFAEILYTPAPCAADADAPPESLGLDLPSRGQQCEIKCFTHTCSIQCGDGERAVCKCVQKSVPGGWQWIPVCECR